MKLSGRTRGTVMLKKVRRCLSDDRPTVTITTPGSSSSSCSQVSTSQHRYILDFSCLSGFSFAKEVINFITSLAKLNPDINVTDGDEMATLRMTWKRSNIGVKVVQIPQIFLQFLKVEDISNFTCIPVQDGFKRWSRVDGGPRCECSEGISGVFLRQAHTCLGRFPGGGENFIPSPNVR